MKPLFSFKPNIFSTPSHSVVLIKHTDLMAIIAMIMGAVLVTILAIIFFTVDQQQKNSEAEESDSISNNSPGNGRGIESEINLPEPGILETHSQPINLPSEVQHELPKNMEEQAKVVTVHQLTILFPGLPSQMAPLQTLRTEAQAEVLKNGFRIACLVISVSTTGIVSFLAGYTGNDQSSIRNKLLLKAVIVSLCSSLFSALILLIISTINLNFSCSILTVRILLWISTGLMTLGLALLIAFYSFHLP